MTTLQSADPKLRRNLILDERFDLMLCQKFRGMTKGDLKTLLENLIEVEKKHVEFWERFFNTHIPQLDPGRRIKFYLFSGIGWMFGEKAIHMLLEAIEVHGIRKYLGVWALYENTPLGDAVKEILRDEMEHEDMLVTGLRAHRISPERIRNIFLGFNDGLVEMLGAVSGFFAVLDHPSSVLLAAFSVAFAGSFSMGAGVFAASSSENEVKKIAEGKRRFLDGEITPKTSSGNSVREGLVVAVSYLIGAMVPVLPVLFGATSLLFSAASAGAVIILISFILAFISGMDAKRRIGMNLAIIAGAVAVTYMLGSIVKQMY